MRHLLCTGDYGNDIDFFGVGLPEIQASINHSPTALAWLQNASTLVFRGLLLIGARAGTMIAFFFSPRSSSGASMAGRNFKPGLASCP
ncbi:hypothetical protein CVS27_14645 [Arthrobacter glacialis]|uniref:Uncharacterized protein n=1 Tax=Arthrobacter glacialis TaxID=1664 RepID=A0A2S3ZUF9_ARTGL|nr:hypothetical protein CVS27_14645 [Arthrobacter glacialis]